MTHSVYYTISLLLHNKNKIWLENGENTFQLSLYAFPSAITEFSYYVLRFFFFFLLFTHQILRQILERPKTDYVQLEIKLERKKSRGDEWLYFWICRKKGKSNGDLKWRAKNFVHHCVCAVGYCTTSFLFFDFVLEKKKRKQTF